MNRRPVNAMLVFLAFAISLAGGFFIGKREGEKRGEVHRELSTTLRRELKESQRRMEEQRETGNAMEEELVQARSKTAECRDQYERLTYLGYGLSFVGPVIPGIPTSVDDEILAQHRIAELECEVASLKEMVEKYHSDTVGEPTKGRFQQTSGSSQAQTVELQAAKEQCTALTKKGVRCSRNARSNGKCWQHGG